MTPFPVFSFLSRPTIHAIFLVKSPLNSLQLHMILVLMIWLAEQIFFFTPPVVEIDDNQKFDFQMDFECKRRVLT